MAAWWCVRGCVLKSWRFCTFLPDGERERGQERALVPYRMRMNKQFIHSSDISTDMCFFCCCCCRSARWRAFIFAALTTFLAHNPFIIIKTDAQNAGMAWVSACADEEMCQEPAAGSNNVYSSPFLHFVFFFFVQQRFMAVLTFSFCWFRKLSTFFCYLSLSVSCMACALHRPAIRDEGMKQKIGELHKQHALSNGSISFWYAIQQQHENW